jgi:DNA-binding Lrp family transcriptional regulator
MGAGPQANVLNMSRDAVIIRNYFAKLRLEPEIGEIYWALHVHGPQTISQLARHSGVERTKIYRLMDRLTELSLIEAEVHYKRTILKAAPVANLRLFITKQEESLRDLKEELGSVEQLLVHTASLNSPTTRVQAYQGSDGLKQLFWNQTKAHGETVAILYENMQSRTNLTFFERWAQRCNELGLTFRGVVSDHFVTSQNQWYAAHHNERLIHWKARYVPGAAFPIRHSTVVYNDVVMYYNWLDEEIFGMEIYNQEIADAQRRFFELLWERGTPIVI